MKLGNLSYINFLYTFLIFLFSCCQKAKVLKGNTCQTKSWHPQLRQISSLRSRTVWNSSTLFCIVQFKWWVSSHIPKSCQLQKNSLKISVIHFLKLISSKLLETILSMHQSVYLDALVMGGFIFSCLSSTFDMYIFSFKHYLENINSIAASTEILSHLFCFQLTNVFQRQWKLIKISATQPLYNTK